jgi:hypothetical protein
VGFALKFSVKLGLCVPREGDGGGRVAQSLLEGGERDVWILAGGLGGGGGRSAMIAARTINIAIGNWAGRSNGGAWWCEVDSMRADVYFWCLGSD